MPRRSGVPSIMSAGNLFGITRTAQPGVLGAVPDLRTATISGGVLSSCPSQKGQKEPSAADSCDGTKSMGRRLRSVAMMTQVFEIGSCLSSDIDSLRKSFVRRGSSGPEEPQKERGPRGWLARRGNVPEDLHDGPLVDLVVAALGPRDRPQREGPHRRRR